VIPSFAVVGHPNKGKSSIVATLAEEDRIEVSPVPGTTRSARRYTFRLDGEPLYALIDTPGFQRARECFAWLETHSASASDRAQTVARFVEAHADDPRFHDECELLRPLVEGAGILYVVDGAKPYGSEYEIEMQILRWTGRPRMALINMIGAGNYVTDWQRALDQYFSIVRVFDAVHADFDKRLDLLRAFAELNEPWREPLQRACDALISEQAHRCRQSAEEIAALLVYGLTRKKAAPLHEGEDRTGLERRLNEQLKADLRARESECRQRVEGLYRHFHLRREDSSDALLGADLFAAEGWELFGLSRQQLLVTGALSGAIAGSGVDLLLGGASLMLGAGVGATLGTLGAMFGAGELAKVKVLGQRLGGRLLQVGPVRDPNFPWVLLGRAWLHFRLISERNHARREALAVDATMAEHLVEALPMHLRRELQGCFVPVSRGDDSAAVQSRLADALVEVLSTEVAQADAGIASGEQR
jgi:hypothetical protein